MIRILLAAAALAVLPWLAPRPAHAQGDEQTLVDRATLALQEMVNQTLTEDPRKALGRARAVMICPRVFKAGFFFGGEGGACVLLARAGNGTWSYPAFYGMGSGSFGFQIGIQDAQFVMMIMTEKGLRAILDSQFKLGADASLAIATIGAGIQGSTTGALGADIVAFSQTRGLYGGVSIEGSLMGQKQRSGTAPTTAARWAAQQIVIDMQATNPGADPLRDVLTRFGTGEQKQAAVPPPPLDYQPPAAAGHHRSDAVAAARSGAAAEPAAAARSHLATDAPTPVVSGAMDAPAPFWKTKTLEQMSHDEWESLCDGCGRCCLHKLRDDDTGALSFTNVACRLLDLHSCQCSDYAHRRRKVPDCVALTPAEVRAIDWLPPSCAYRRLAEGKDLAWWHPLVSGDPDTVHEAGISVRGRADQRAQGRSVRTPHRRLARPHAARPNVCHRRDQ